MNKIDTYDIVDKYNRNYGFLMENIRNSIKRSLKTKDFNRMKRIKSPFVDDCMVCVSCDSAVVLFKIDGRWVFRTECVSVDGDFIDAYNIISEHSLDRVRCRLNMYATPIETVLYRFLKAYTSPNAYQTSTERLGVCAYLDGLDSICPIESESVIFNGKWVFVNVIKTILDQPDKKTNDIRDKQDGILEKVLKY